jgi:hypothetical protein
MFLLQERINAFLRVRMQQILRHNLKEREEQERKRSEEKTEQQRV